MDEPETWLRTPVVCPRCDGRWRSLERFYDETVDKESIYQADRIQHIPDPPLDSTVARMIPPLEQTVIELREEYNDVEGAEIHLHCGLCAIEMVWKSEVPGYQAAFVTASPDVE